MSASVLGTGYVNKNIIFWKQSKWKLNYQEYRLTQWKQMYVIRLIHISHIKL